VESYKYHDITCPFLADLFPDLVKRDDIMELDHLLGSDHFYCASLLSCF
jgi:hypothetical protein